MPGAPQPLAGRKVVVTRPRAQAAGMVARLEALGAVAIPFPTIRVDPAADLAALDAAVARAGSYDWVVFTSANGVDAVRARLEALGRGVDLFGAAKVCAVGPATAQALASLGADVALQPGQEFTAEALLAAMTGAADWLGGARVLFFRAAEGREVLAEGLTAAGAAVDLATAYRTVALTEAPEGAVDALAEHPPDVVAFTSPSTAKSFIGLIGLRGPSILGGTAIASIGPVTTKAIEALGYTVAIEPSESTVPALVDAIVDHFSK